MAVLNAMREYCAFYFIERGSIALRGSMSLYGRAAEELRSHTNIVVPIVPFWHGSILSYDSAWRSWGIPDVHCVTFGFLTKDGREQLVSRIMERPPLGLVGHELVADPPAPRHLPRGGFLFPGAAILNDGSGQWVDRQTGLRFIAYDDEYDWMTFGTAFDFADSAPEYEEDADAAMLELLALRVGTRYQHVTSSSGFDQLIQHANELFVSGAYGAAGTVAGVAFEQLMRAALSADDAAWAAAQRHAPLARVIDRVIAANGWQSIRGRLDQYKDLRNDLAHRLGDARATPLTEDSSLFERVDDLLGWLERQQLPPHGIAELVDVAPDADIESAVLIAAALEAGTNAAARATTTPAVIEGEHFEEGLEGSAWVTVADMRRAFTQWLADEHFGTPNASGVNLLAPERTFERALAWADAVSSSLDRAGIPCTYAGRRT